MAEAKLLICDRCGATTPESEQTLARAPGWWRIFGDGTLGKGRLDLCSNHCVAAFFSPVVVAPKGEAYIHLNDDQREITLLITRETP